MLYGADQTVKWFVGSTCVVQAPYFLNGPMLSCTAKYTSITGMTIQSLSPGQVFPAILCSAEGNGIAKVVVQNLGGIEYDGASRFAVEDTVVTAYTSVYGFNLTNSSIGFLMRCNSVPGPNTAAGSTSYYLSGCESINVMNCEANGSPDYALQHLSSNDCEYYDVETNGANVTQIVVENSTDVIFTRIYVLQSAPTAVSISGCILTQFIGGWIGGATGNTVAISASSQVFLTSLWMNNAATQTSALVYVTGSCYSLEITNCAFSCGSQAPYCIEWESTDTFSHSTIIGNSFYEPATAPIYLGTQTDPTLQIIGNGGFNPVGTVSPPASPLVSGTAYINASGVPITIYQPAYATTSGTAGTVAVALGTSSTPSTIYTKQIPGATTSTAPDVCTLRVPAGWYYSFTATGATLLDANIQGE